MEPFLTHRTTAEPHLPTGWTLPPGRPGGSLGKDLRASLGTSIILAAMVMGAIGFTHPARMVAASPGPTGDEVIQRVMQTITAAPEVIAADAEFRLRVKKPLSEPPDCVFRGTVTVVSRRPTIKIDDQTTGVLCWVVNRYVLGRELHPRETLESFLSRFEYDVLGVKVVGNDRHYLVAARAKDPRTKPGAMIGWIDFDRGLLIEGTVKYAWGDIDNEQSYVRMQNMWMLTYQYLYSARFGTSMEILYNNFRFGPP